MLHLNKVHVFITRWNRCSHANFIINVDLIVQVSNLILTTNLFGPLIRYRFVDPLFIKIITLTAGLCMKIWEFGEDHFMQIRAL